MYHAQHVVRLTLWSSARALQTVNELLPVERSSPGLCFAAAAIGSARGKDGPK
jgi:hypothetical protein